MIVAFALTSLIPIASGILVVLAAVKAIGFMGSKFGGVVDFTRALNRVPDITGLAMGQAEIKASVDKAAADTATYIEQFAENFHTKFATLTRQVAQSDIDAAIATFKAHTTFCPTASFIVETSTDGSGNFIWANKVWYDICGLTEDEAKSGQYWSGIHPDDLARMRAASDMATGRRAMLDIHYRLINLRTNEVMSAHAMAWPLVVAGMEPADQTVYLGSISVAPTT
jgi:PAS domain-containing protein